MDNPMAMILVLGGRLQARVLASGNGFCPGQKAISVDVTGKDPRISFLPWFWWLERTNPASALYPAARERGSGVAPRFRGS
jgi:hypothetical protein